MGGEVVVKEKLRSDCKRVRGVCVHINDELDSINSTDMGYD